MKSTATRWLLLALVLCLLPVLESAGQGTTASMTGTVEDENGDPLPGVNVIALHQPTGTEYGVATNAQGRFRIRGMRVGGPYSVTVSFVGYQSKRREGIQLQLDETREVNFELQPKTQEMEEVQVIGRRSEGVIDKERTGAATNVSQEQIERLPTISRSIGDFARLVPQAGGSGSLGGANDRYNNIQIDGATLNDVFGLGDAVPGSQAGAQPISIDAIEEFNVEIAPYDVRSGGFTGGQINAITKSGSNQFEGFARWRGGSELTTGDLDGRGTGEFRQGYYVLGIGGPIIEDELFFFVNAEVKRESSPLDARVSENVTGPNVFPESPDLLGSVRQTAQDVYGYDPGGIDPLTERQDDEKLLVKLDWNVADNHQLTLRNNYVNARDDQGLSRGTNSFSFSNRQYVFRSLQNSSTVQLNSAFGNNVTNEARFVYTRIRDERDVQDAAFPEVTISLGSGRTLGMGIDRFSQANRLDQDLFEFTDNFTYDLGQHSITLGTSNEFYRFGNLFIQDYFGEYTFESFETPDGEEISATEAFERGQPSQYRYSYATEFADSRRPEAEFTAMQLGGYVQDEWTPIDALRLTIGMRVDVPILPDAPTFNETAFEAFGRSTDNIASGNPLWSPRLGFNYDKDFLLTDQSTQIRGGVGIFSGNPPYVWISNQYSNTGADLNRIDANFNPGEAFYGPNAPDEGRRFMPGSAAEEPTRQPCPVGAATCTEDQYSDQLQPEETTEINLISDDFTYPQTFRTNLAIDQELPSNFVATLEGIYSKTINDVTFRNINIEPPSEDQYPLKETKYGRPLYGTPGAGFGGSPNRVSSNFTNSILLENTDKGYQYNLTAQLQRNVREGFGGSVSYTYGRAKSVNSGTSSRAISNWQFNPSLDINNPRLGTAAFEVRHRFLGSVDYSIRYADRFATTVGLVYEGESGSPFSWIYFGNAGGDTQPFNDLVYVPENRNDIVLESDNWELMDAFIESEEALREARGSIVERGSAREPWQHVLDLQVTQTVQTFGSQRVEITATVENVLNLLNDDWGRSRFASFGNAEAWSFEGYVVPEDVGTQVNGRVLTEDDVGKPRVTFEDESVYEKLEDRLFNTSNIASRWRARIGIKYAF